MSPAPGERIDEQVFANTRYQHGAAYMSAAKSAISCHKHASAIHSVRSALRPSLS